MDVLAKPWTGLVFEALEGGALRFSELRDAIGTIGDRMLSVRLRELEQRSLVVRRVIAGPPVRVEYELTAAGRGFREVANAVRRWGTTILSLQAETAAAAVLAPVAAPTKASLALAKAAPKAAARRRSARAR
jgi:DNA-binding HxlR family transcriptional regulator